MFIVQRVATSLNLLRYQLALFMVGFSQHFHLKYMHDLPVKRNNANISCKVNGTMTNHIFYVDDNVLLAVGASGLQSL